MGYNIAIIDVVGLIGHEILNILAENPETVESVVGLTSKRLAGREISFGDQDIITKCMDNFDYKGIDFVFIAGYPKEALNVAKTALKADAKVIDCTGVTLFDEPREGLISLPTASSSQLISAIKPLHDEVNIKRVVVSTYEATSGIGKDGMDELFNQSRKFFVSDAMDTDIFMKQITFNVIPQVDDFMPDGMTKAEWRMNAEIKKCLDKNIKVAAHCVTVPVFVGHGMMVNIECEKDIDMKAARKLWRNDNNTIVIDESSEMEYVTPVEIAGEDHIYISRIRSDSTVDNGLSFWCVTDNIRHVALKATNIMHTLSAT